jgi:hypothetical protein
VQPDNATNKNVTWSSSNPGVATVNNGTVTAVTAGSATITVTTQDGGKTATCAVTVSLKVAAMPTASVGTGNYTETQSVTLSTTTPEAKIYYTTDGTTTPSSSSEEYSSAISIDKTTTLKAIAIKEGMTDSGIFSATYTFNAVTPTASVGEGNYTEAQSVTLSTTTAEASIYYTTDDSTPSSSSNLYSSAISIGVTTTLKAIAVKEGMTNSGIFSALYTINIPVSFTDLTADGSAITVSSTTKLTLTFDKDIADLTAEDITLTTGSTGATKGALNKTGTSVYELSVSDITESGQVTVAVSKNSHTITPASKDVNVYYLPASNEIVIGDATVKLYLNGVLLQDGGSTDIESAETGTYTVNIASGEYSAITWYVNGKIVSTGTTNTSVVLTKRIEGTYLVTVEAAMAGKKNTGSHSFVVK